MLLIHAKTREIYYVISLVPDLFAKVRRGHSILFLEEPAEIERVIIADNTGNFRNIIIGRFQQCLCVRDTQRKNILCGSGICIFFKVANEPADAHIRS